MSSALVEPNPPTFFDLYSQEEVLPDEIEDFIDRWHEGAASGPRSPPLHEYLGLMLDVYEVWVLDPDVLPLELIARREARPLVEVVTTYVGALPLARPALDTATVTPSQRLRQSRTIFRHGRL
jgi:hypothetical protein